MLALRNARAAKSRAAIRNGLLCIGGFLVIATIGGVWFAHEQSVADAARAVVKERQDALRGELLAPGDLTPAKATELLRRIDATRSEWQDGPDGEAISRRAEQARAVITAAKTAEVLDRDIAAVSARLAATGLTREQWEALHTEAKGLIPRAEKGDAALKAKVAELARSVEAGMFTALVAAGGAAGVRPEDAVPLLTEAVDLAQDAAAANSKNHDVQREWAQREHSVVGLLDVAEAALPESARAGAAFVDLALREDEWVAGRGGSLTRKVQGDELDVECAAGDKAKSGVVVLRHHDWHAGVLACDVELRRGKAVLFARVRDKIAETGCGGLVLSTTPAEGAVVVPAGQPVHVEMTVLGNKVVAEVATATPQRVELQVTNDERRGGIAVVLHPDAALAVRHVRQRRFGRSA